MSGSLRNGKWTDDEQKRFLDALLLYPKDWNRITKHIGTRTKQQVQSHAQKYQKHIEDEKARYQLMHYWADSSQDPSHRIRRKRVPTDNAALTMNKPVPSPKGTPECSSRKKVRRVNKKKAQVSSSSQPPSALKEQKSNPLSADTIHPIVVDLAAPINQIVPANQNEPSQQHFNNVRTSESDSAVDLLVSLRNMDKRTPSIAEPMKQKPCQQPNTPNQVILYNCILVPCVPAFTLPRYLV